MVYFFHDVNFIRDIIVIIREANSILRKERTPDMTIETKTDKNGRESKVTSGDIKSNNYIMEQLHKINERLKREHVGNFNIISEEMVEEEYSVRNNKHIDGSWLVDPLDGTADYCNFELSSPCYTANIGLVMDGEPVFGIFSIPEDGILFYGMKDVGSFCIDDENIIDYNNDSGYPGKPIKVNSKKDLSKSNIRIAISASHMNTETRAFIEKHFQNPTCLSFASSMKLGAVADGFVDIYPRCGPTYEWDTCAADAVVRCAGGGVYIYENLDTPLNQYSKMLTYNKPDLLNPSFIVM